MKKSKSGLCHSTLESLYLQRQKRGAENTN